MVIAKKYMISKYFEGEPKRSDLTLVEEELSPLKDGEFLIQAEFLSVDPYMRSYICRYPLGSTMIGSQVAKIIESKNASFPIGKRVVANAGWRSHTVVDENSGGHFNQPPYILPDFGDLPASLGLGVLGMPGNTAYFGLVDILQPKAGETLVVSGSAGAVGSHVGQIGKILGLNVIGITGSDARCKWLHEELGFDHVINYKTQDVDLALKEVAPNKFDCYFDNVGGKISGIVLNRMNTFGRTRACCSISGYNADPNASPKNAEIQPVLVFNDLIPEQFQYYHWLDRWFEGIEQNYKWIKEGRLKYRETVTEGFENTFDAFLGVVRAENTGKAIVKV